MDQVMWCKPRLKTVLGVLKWWCCLVLVVFGSFLDEALANDDGIVDLIESSKLYDEPDGIVRILGRCWNDTERSEPKKSDWAYRWSEQAQISLTTQDHFPDGFPTDFSILIAARPSPGR
ncbi:unnamed protein product [Phaedon cochleariae]|uniref:Secreted protein n=1 Tax=Phaedon cochleariae TaxID=80249 RepID=A0A9N9SLK5_PHACE|nr:unnamed protein product [Phaedon cochleariae]